MIDNQMMIQNRNKSGVNDCKVDFITNQPKNGQKYFKLEKLDIDYKNTTQMLNSTENTDKPLSIINLLCIKQGNKLVKITQINLSGNILEIKDQLSLQTDNFKRYQKETQKLNKQKLQIIRQQIVAPIEEKQYKKNNKNIVKNMIRLFRNWLEKQEMLVAKERLLSIIKNQKINNTLIQKIALDLQINKMFVQFLQNHATEEINASKILDKKSHQMAIKYYLRFLRVRPLSKIDLLKISR